MKFSIFLGNHDRQQFDLLRDMVMTFRYGLEELGHSVVISDYTLFHDRMNLIFEDFGETFNAKFIGPNRDVPYGIICTEPFDGERLITYGTHPYRTQGFLAAARDARFLWCFLDGSTEIYRSAIANGQCHYVPLGYVEKLAETRHLPMAERDIDILFFGRVTPYREAVLDELAARGCGVMATNRSAQVFVRNAFIERSKLNLAMKLDETWEHTSPGRLSYLVINGQPTLAERCRFADPVEGYVFPTSHALIVERCLEILGNIEENAILARKLAERFKVERRMAAFLAPAIDAIS
ncbi:MAG: hypothetical protein H7840_05615 [Alphaproteobacteria bacterium]